MVKNPQQFQFQNIDHDIQNRLAGEWDIISRAPGRINLIGEHTDYNGGLVFPAAIDKYMYFACKKNGTRFIHVEALDTKEKYSIDLDELVETPLLWANYLTGVLVQYAKRGFKLEGLDVCFTSEIPIGSGLSSSAALEIAFILAVSALHDIQLDNWELIDISNTSNHEFLGIKIGIMDQFASLFGKQDKAMVLDCENRRHQYVDTDLGEYEILLINSNVKHNHQSSGYNDRVRECKQALYEVNKLFPDVKYLCAEYDISRINFSSIEVENRAKYLQQENKRVKKFQQALTQNDLSACGQLLTDSHSGLSKLYDVSCEELDFLVDTLLPIDGVLGSRMMGGGFGGCTINLIHHSAKELIIATVTEKYRHRFNIEPDFYSASISNGAGLMDMNSI